MTVVVSRETYSHAESEVREILPMQWQEMSLNKDTIPLDVDWTFYERAFALGLATIYTARDDGKLVGYIIFFLTPRHPHYNHMWIRDDTVYIHPDYRTGGVATALFDFFEADLSKDGPVVIQIETRAGHEALDHLLKSRGYYDTGHVYGKRFA